ncbi:hypothetical protein, partial [Salmonella sp. zj-f54]|uniref:hypothetical protein n=1 Tax=Salmonella sp. zj-f54 TaxID=2582617 RepID=UPI001F2E5F57
ALRPPDDGPSILLAREKGRVFNSVFGSSVHLPAAARTARIIAGQKGIVAMRRTSQSAYSSGRN